MLSYLFFIGMEVEISEQVSETIGGEEKIIRLNLINISGQRGKDILNELYSQITDFMCKVF
jgi:hypothetical protein